MLIRQPGIGQSVPRVLGDGRLKRGNALFQSRLGHLSSASTNSATTRKVSPR